MPELSVIIPIKNEENNIFSLANDIRKALHSIDHEIIWVNDGSTDHSSQRIIDQADEKTILVELSKNFGQSIAMKAGIDHSKGRYIAFLDGDGQNDPNDIPNMLAYLMKGNWDMVAGNRKNRKDPIVKKVPSKIANALIRASTGIHVKDYGCTLKIITREKAILLDLRNGMHRFIPILIKRSGGKISEYDVNHYPRMKGKSKYGLERIFIVVRDLLRVIFGKRKKLHIPPKLYTVKELYYCNKPNMNGCQLQTANCKL